MLSTLRVIPKLSPCQTGVIGAFQPYVYTKNKDSQHLQRRQVHKDRQTAPDIQEYEPYSKLPYYDGKKGHLMYVGNMTKIVKGIKMFSISTSLVSIGSIPLIRSAIEESITKAGVMGGISTLIFLTPLLLHFVTKKYVTDIYFNAETEVFTLATKSLLLRRKEMEFYSTDVEVPFVGGAFVTHRVKKKPFFIERELFFNKDVYVKMVGYDKPFDDPFFKKGIVENQGQNQTVNAENERENQTSEDFGLFRSEETENERQTQTVKDRQKQESSNSSEVSENKDEKKFGLFN